MTTTTTTTNVLSSSSPSTEGDKQQEYNEYNSVDHTQGAMSTDAVDESRAEAEMMTMTTTTTTTKGEDGETAAIGALGGGPTELTLASTPVFTSRKQLDVADHLSTTTMTPVINRYYENVEEKKESEPLVAPETPANIHQSASGCETMLLEAAVDDCVGYMDGVDVHHAHLLDHQEAAYRQIALQHGLSEAEAALIRLQMADAVTNAAAAAAAAVATGTNPIIDVSSSKDAATLMPRFDAMFNVCGNEDSVNETLCEGVMLPIDTTLPTSLPGDTLVDSRLGLSARSLIDVSESQADGCEASDAGTVNGRPGNGVLECAICNASVDGSALSPSAGKPTLCRLPCCDPSLAQRSNDGQRRNLDVCTACVLVLTVATTDGRSRVGRCPRCRTWISVTTLLSTRSEMDVQEIDMTPATCKACQLFKSPIVDDATCDACFLGKHTPLVYECEECHNTQQIEHALYRCQTTPQSFGNEMSPCSNCHRSTHWRVQHDNLPSIPANDVPEEWGEEYILELARAKVQRARQEIAQLDVSIVDSTTVRGQRPVGQQPQQQHQQVPLLKRKTSFGGNSNSEGCSIM